MSKSLTITNGDLAVSSRNFDVVNGINKLKQDLHLHILERLGTDPSTPGYGSVLDGGRDEQGNEIPSFIGQLMSEERAADARADVLRIVTRYQQDQLEKMKREAIRFRGQHTLESGEVIHRIDSVVSRIFGTTIIVQVVLTTLSNQSLRLTIPIEAV